MANVLTPELVNHSVDPIGSPGENASGKEEAQLVRAALMKLDAVQREVLELSFFEGLSHQQIADRLQSPLGTVKSRIRQGLNRLRTKLTPTFQERNQE
ncbi:ECF RNA polymerase sigma factor RpoE [Bythopirellula polymerisocia]|uniref:ECF RNA polymerase sigma factor RpoE n=1 Tax=Bythopirellula polymerisocia TaxID=2528003 RepID=A0A5C6CF77_9BACT|nr:ECF RNA polymerase sigma factor RpoE [Bythopirellula polymerisocia]